MLPDCLDKATIMQEGTECCLRQTPERKHCLHASTSAISFSLYVATTEMAEGSKARKAWDDPSKRGRAFRQVHRQNCPRGLETAFTGLGGLCLGCGQRASGHQRTICSLTNPLISVFLTDFMAGSSRFRRISSLA